VGLYTSLIKKEICPIIHLHLLKDKLEFMLEKVKIKEKKIDDYRKIILPSLLKEIKSLSKELKGLKVNLVNSTSKGGGVAEILNSLIPLLRDVKIDASWYVISGDKQFFNLTKEIHNALQGKDFLLTLDLRKKYRANMERISKEMKGMSPDVWVMHDPQTVGIIDYFPNLHPCISHIHIDTSFPNKDVWNFIMPFLLKYDKIIFSEKEFRQTDIPIEKTSIIPPAIDPLTEKNKVLSKKESKNILKDFGIDIKRPLISQISRFDPWKNPSGVVDAYKIAKKKIPGLQLALVGLLLASDDPEAAKVYHKVEKETKGDPDIFLFFNPDKLSNLTVDRFVNAFQTASDIILQNSTKEGFGLTVSEAMWKEKAVIGGNVGGIKIQIKDGENGFLVSSSKEAAEKIIFLFENPKIRKNMGKKAKKTVLEKFLMPRLLRDYMLLLKDIAYENKRKNR